MKTAALASEIARTVNSISVQAVSDVGYQTHRSPFVLQQIAKGKKFDKQSMKNDGKSVRFDDS